MSSPSSAPENARRSNRSPGRVGFGVPGISDRRWRYWTRPLLVFICKRPQGRTWPQLHAWARENNLRKDMARQLIAWLEWHEKITFDAASKHWKGQPHVRVQAH